MNKFEKIFSGLGVLLILLLIPFTVYLSQNQTQIKSRASSPESVKINLSLALDSLSPGANPVHSQRNIFIYFFDTNNNEIASAAGLVNFDPAKGIFTGTVDIGSLNPGAYMVRVKTDKHLKKLIPGIQNITQPTITIPQITLIDGDINNDNALDIKDYNEFLKCFGNKTCANKNFADLNDDGKVDEIDYNVLMRSISSLSGD